MLNHILVNLFTVLTLLTPVSYQSLAKTHTNADQKMTETRLEETNQNLLTIQTFMQEVLFLLEDDFLDLDNVEKLPVTTMVTSQSAEPKEPELTPEEEQAIALTEWKSKFPTYESSSHQTEFIQRIAPAAVLIANAQGIYPSVMIAQAGLESSWGQSGLAQSYNNLMGTKGNTEGKSVTVRTREDQNGESVYINAGFTIYDSWGHSLFHYGTLMKNGLSWDAEYYKGTWVKNTDSYRDATAWLQGRYASDGSYASKLNQTIESFNLTQFDEIEPFDTELETALDNLYAMNQ